MGKKQLSDINCLMCEVRCAITFVSNETESIFLGMLSIMGVWCGGG